MALDDQDQDSLRSRSEQAIGELAQALLDSQVLENAVAAAFGAREKALEAQHAALAALNLPSAGDMERLERRLRSVSQRLDEVEDEFDRLSGRWARCGGSSPPTGKGGLRRGLRRLTLTFNFSLRVRLRRAGRSAWRRRRAARRPMPRRRPPR